MRAMVLNRLRQPLVEEERPDPLPGPGEIRVRVEACGVCRTDLHVVDGELENPRVPIIPGHEIVGRVDAVGPGVMSMALGARVGIPWLGHACGHCFYCGSGQENLCDTPAFTGYSRDGGYATHAIADASFVFPLDEAADPVAIAPLLCAGLIGWRTLKLAGRGKKVGLYGFGAAAHIIAQVCRWQGREVYAFTRAGDEAAQAFALSMGAVWAGASEQRPPTELDAALIFAPVGALVPAALGAMRKGGRVVCGGIHMTDIPAFPYRLLWEERSVSSVANLTREDGVEFLKTAKAAGIVVETKSYELNRANEALADLRAGETAGRSGSLPPVTEMVMAKWQTFARAAALACVVLAPLSAVAANPDILKHIVEGACVPAMQATGRPLPCSKVDLNRRFAVLKDILGKTQYLVLPTDPIAGIEAPELLKPDAPNFWQYSWEARSFVEQAAGRSIPRDFLGLAINSAEGRSQNQLHIHIDCVRRDVIWTLKRHQAAIGPDWKPMPVWLRGHHYLAMRVEGSELGKTDPFKLLADKLPKARAAMGDQTLVVIGATFKNGQPGFYVLNDHAGATPNDQASGEELLDHSCSVLQGT